MEDDVLLGRMRLTEGNARLLNGPDCQRAGFV
jgi:hypothetical protein